MSSSSKKTLRNEAAAAKLTEKQTAEKKEAAKLKLYTSLFVVVLAILVVIAATVAISRGISSSGMREKKTIAATVGSHEINNVELNYYYYDAVNNFNSNYGSYALLYGLDPEVALDEQFYDEEAGKTWADYFVESATVSAQQTYALVDAANAAGYTLSEEDQAEVKTLGQNIDLYASMAGASDADAYLKTMYGNGSSKESYLNYFESNMLAASYQNAYKAGLTYTAEQINEADAAAPENYNSYSYNQYYMAISKFMAEDAEETDEAKEEAAFAAELAAKQLTAASITTVEEFDEAIANLAVNEGTTAASTDFAGTRYTSINSKLTDWISDSSRKAGDKTYVANETVSTDEDGNEKTTLNGYYVVFYNGVSENLDPLVNVRHILVSFEGGTEENGVTVYSDEEKAAAKAAAEDILNQWLAGDATEESFAALAAEKTTDPGSAENGGLYENVYPGQMVTAFNDWCFDASRNVGDYGIVETNYGYHVMFFSGKADMNYREYLITNDLRSEDASSWYYGLIDATPIVEGDTKYISKSIKLKRS